MSCRSCTDKIVVAPELCPVRKAIDELHQRSQKSQRNQIIVGSDAVVGGAKSRKVDDVGSTSHESTPLSTQQPKLSISYGDMNFKLTCKKIDLARFKISKPTLTKCIARFTIPVPTFVDYYREEATSSSKTMFLALFARVYDQIKRRLLLTRDLSAKSPLKIMVPPPMPIFDARALCLVPKILTEAVNWIISAVNDDLTTVRSAKKVAKKIESLPKFTAEFPAGNFPEIPETLDVKSALKYLDEYQAAEFVVLEYAIKVEEYQAEAYARLEEVLSVISVLDA